MIPFVDVKAQYRSIKREVDQAVMAVLESGQFVLGDEVRAFEQDFARYSGANHAVAVNSGTSALHLGLLAAGIGPGDEVITTPMTFVATTAAIIYAGARPVFVDIRPNTWNIDPELIAPAITKRTKAILPVDLHGRPADLDPIQKIAHKYGLTVIEDAAQAHGAEYRGRRIGSLSDITCFSFYPGKNLGAYGEGGAVVTNNPDYDRAMRSMRDWGQEDKYWHVIRGYNYRMDAIQGAVLRVKLNHIEDWIQARHRHAASYGAALSDSDIVLPADASDTRHVYHVYAVCVRNRDEVQRKLGEARIATGIHYPIPVHLQPAYAEFGNGKGSLPVAERVASELLSLPMFPELAPQQIESVSRVLLDEASRKLQPT
jgi:dTDP-4-amino-4,6-dideoxygalactose transaminase